MLEVALLAGVLLFYTVIGMFVMKYFVRDVPLLTLAFIFFWAAFRIVIIGIAVAFLGAVGGAYTATGLQQGALTFFLLCVLGWLITRDMATRYGTPTKFPAIGAKVVISIIVVLWVISGAAYLIFALISRA